MSAQAPPLFPTAALPQNATSPPFLPGAWNNATNATAPAPTLLQFPTASNATLAPPGHAAPSPAAALGPSGASGPLSDMPLEALIDERVAVLRLYILVCAALAALVFYAVARARRAELERMRRADDDMPVRPSLAALAAEERRGVGRCVVQ